MTAAPAPTLSRRHAAGSAGARALLFTVLGEFVLPSAGTAWTSSLIDVLGRLGVEQKACRQALMRTAADGWLTSERIGRRTRWRLTTSAESLLTDGTARIYGFSATAADWDGHWLLVLARAPETDRAVRHLLRTRLIRAGFGSPAPGVWLSPHTDRRADAEKVLTDCGLAGDAHLFTAAHVGGGELITLARQAFDIDAIEDGYEAFLTEFAAAAAPDPLARTVELVHAWRRFPWVDPQLPRELLPARWSGGQATRLFRRRHARWTAVAQEQWRKLEQAG